MFHQSLWLSMSCSIVSQRALTKQSGLRKVFNHPLSQYCLNFLVIVSDTKYFSLRDLSIWKQHTAIHEPSYHRMFCHWINTQFISAGWYIHQCCIATWCQMSDFLLSVVCWLVNFTVLKTNHRRTSEELDKLPE